jgi:bifunctional non-homologous end joining protein LigD
MHAPREQLPRFIEPMLLQSGLPAGVADGWALELKWDGLRTQLRIDGPSGWTLRSRPGRDCTAEFPELAELACVLRGRRAIVDGEVVHLGPDGKPDFAAISRRLIGRGPRASAGPAATFVAFDLLHLDGRAVRALPYVRRRELLHELLADGPRWRVPRPLAAPLEAVLAVTRDAHLEGVLSKRLSAPYEPGRRSGAWRKHKHRRAEWFMLTGWSSASGDGRARAALHIARLCTGGELIAAGAVQLGLGSPAAQPLRELLESVSLPRRRAGRVPVPPGVAVEVDFHGAPGGPLRDAVLRRVDLAHVVCGEREQLDGGAGDGGVLAAAIVGEPA